MRTAGSDRRAAPVHTCPSSVEPIEAPESDQSRPAEADRTTEAHATSEADTWAAGLPKRAGAQPQIPRLGSLQAPRSRDLGVGRYLHSGTTPIVAWRGS
jgi:hypothetical protein